MIKKQILEELELFSLGTGGIGSWLTPNTDNEVFDRLTRLSSEPLNNVQLNQLLVLGHGAPASDGFFNYYWATAPENHTYSVESIPGFDSSFLNRDAIVSLDHLKWGLYRLYVDALLYFGNVRSGYRALRAMGLKELNDFFTSRRINTELTKARGPSLPLEEIQREKRYLIAESVGRSFGTTPDSETGLRKILLEALLTHKMHDGGNITVGDLLASEHVTRKYGGRRAELEFAAAEIRDEFIDSKEQLESLCAKLAADYQETVDLAAKNTRRYLSMAGDLDVYVAATMNSREEYRDMAGKMEQIFSDIRLRSLELRYFDPTLSAGNGHQDKGLIEGLLLKCAKVVVYCPSEARTFSKDADAAMALALGKPVIFLCDTEQYARIKEDGHRLSHMLDAESGTAVGAIFTDSLSDVSELLYRIFENRMEYELEHPMKGYLRLKETVTGSVVRLQTNDPLLTETIFNHYHGAR